MRLMHTGSSTLTKSDAYILRFFGCSRLIAADFDAFYFTKILISINLYKKAYNASLKHCQTSVFLMPVFLNW